MKRKANITARLLDSDTTESYDVLLTVTDQSMVDDDNDGHDLEEAVTEALDPHMSSFGVYEPFEVVMVVFEGEHNFVDFDAEGAAAELTV